MSIAKVIEVISEGKTIESAVNAAVSDAEKSIKNVKQLDINHIHAIIKNGKVDSYRVNANITFVVEH